MFETVELAELSRKVAGVEVTLASDDELCAAAIALEQARAALDAAESHVLAELDGRGVCDRDFGLSTASWLADRTHASRPHVVARLGVGAALRTFSVVDAALANGSLTFEHARAMAGAANPRIGDDLAACQGELVDLAQHAPFAVWRRDLRVLAYLLDQDGAFDPDRDLARNHVHLGVVAGDHVVLSGELVGEAALGLVHAVEAQADRMWRQYRNDHERGVVATIPRRATLRALALVSLCRKGQATDPAASRAPGVDISLVLDDRNGRAGQSRVRRSTPCWSARWACPSTSGAPCDWPRRGNDGHWPSATAGACSPAAMPQPAGATCTTSTIGSEAVRPTAPTWPSSAGTTTASPTARTGRWPPTLISPSPGSPPPGRDSPANANGADR